MMAVEEILRTGTEVARQLRISRAKAYWLIQRGEIPSVRMGRNVRVRQRDIEEYIRAETAAPHEPGSCAPRWGTHDPVFCPLR